MRHLRKGKQLGRISKQRKALLKSLTVALIEQGRIRTTLAKARVLRPFVEKFLTKAKKGGLQTMRELRKDFNEKTARMLMENWAPLFKERKGGYTRIIKLINRTSDASPMAYIEFVEQLDMSEKAEKKTVKKKASSKDVKLKTKSVEKKPEA